VRHTALAGLPTAPGARDNTAPHIRVLKPKRCRHRRLRARIRIFDQSRLRYAHARAPKRARKTQRKRFRITVPLRDLRRGSRHRIRVRVKDSAGNFSRRVVRFRRCR
jgi:hypothetical protein